MGVLFAAKQVFINPESFTFMESIGVLAMVILGGMGSIPGAILGATVVTVLNLQVLKGLSLWLNELQQRRASTILGFNLADLPTQLEPAKYERMVFGIILVLMMIFRPAGHPARAAPAARARRRTASPPRGARSSRRAGSPSASAASPPLNDVDFTLDEGRIASIIGPNGAGKTTLLQRLHRHLRARGGRRSPSRARRCVGRRPDEITALGICRTFQNIRLFGNMTAVENVLVGMHARVALGFWDVLVRGPRCARSRSRRSGTRAAELLERRRPARQGQRARAQPALRRPAPARAGARARPRRPPLLLLDEPTAGMTQGEARSLMELLRRLVARAAASRSCSSSTTCAS